MTNAQIIKKYEKLIKSDACLQYVVAEMPESVAVAAILSAAKEQDDYEWAKWESKNL